MAKPQEPSIEAAQALARHLREHPAAASRPASELAQEFGLETDFVSDILKDVLRHEDVELKPFDLGWLKRLGKGLVAFFDLLTARPVFFVSALSVVFCAVYTTHSVPTLWFPSLFATGLVLHMACYYRHANVRTALYGSLAVWLIFASTYGLARWRLETEALGPSLLAELAAVALVIMIFGVIYAAVASFFSVLGGYVRIRREELAEESMTRQELLERLFDIQERLKSSRRFEAKPKQFIPASFVAWFNRHPFLVAFSGMLALSLLRSVLSSLAIVRFAPNPPPDAALGLLVQIPTLLMTILFVTSLAYLAGNFKRSVILTMTAFALTFSLGGVRFGPSGWAFEGRFYENYSLAIWVFGLTGFGSLWSLVEEKTLRSRRLMEADPAVLVAEMVRLEWKLKVNANDVCVLVVDTAKSSEMKARSDPLVAEYSFREFQKFLAEICAKHGGRVHSTAGDGAVMAFPKCDQAMAAAREIQTDITQFNKHVNRLNSDFNLRVGLHMGAVSGDIKDVQFTEVIDLAAHVQAAAPVRGILVTKAVAGCLPGDRLIPLKEPVDGHEVFLASNPTSDA